jgi:hypothetical protein
MEPRIHAKERRLWSFIHPELDPSQLRFDAKRRQTPTLNLSTLDIVTDILRTSPVNLAANAESSTENLFDTTLELLRK